VVKVGRIAGQFAKPRSSPTEKSSTASSCRAIAATSSTTSSSRGGARNPDPRRQLMAYRQSAATLNLLRAFATGGYANLENAHRWMLGFIKDSPQSSRYKELADRITETLDFMRACGITRAASGNADHRFLHQPRGAAARLRAGDDARRFDDRRLLRDLRPHALDRRPHAPAGPRPCRIHAAASRTRSAQVRPSLKPDGLLQLLDILDPEERAGR
jgi:3-deoxy-7-phosphoheptulonate synthase